MKILFLTNIPSPYRVAFFRELGQLCDLTVLYEKQIASNRDKKWKAEDGQDTYKSIYLSSIIKGKDNAFCPEVTRYLKKEPYDAIIVGVYSTPTGMYAIRYMKRKNIPYYISCDGGLVRKDSKIKYAIKKYFLSGAYGYFSSAQMTDEYLIYYGADSTRIFRFPFTSLFEKDILGKVPSKQDKSELRQKLQMSESRIFLSVGQFIYRKGYDLLLKAAKDLPQSVGIYIVGGKPTEEYVELQKKLNLINVHFVDFQKKDILREYYMAADVFVLPTREDIWGLVINEAMANALPIITTDKCVAGMELIEGNGKIIKADSDEGMKKVLLDYAKMEEDDLQKEAEMSLEIIEKYTVENMAREHMKFLK